MHHYRLFVMLMVMSSAVWSKSLSLSSGDVWQVHDTGKGRAVLVLGGGPAFTAWNLIPLQQKIAKRHRALLFDMRGVGDQAALSLPNGALLDQWVKDIEAVRVASGIQRWTLVGHSWGGLMALLYAKHYPEHVEKLVLLNPVDPEKKGLADILDRINARQQQHNPKDWDADWDTEQSTLTRTEDEIKLYQIRQVLPTYFVDFAQGERYAAQFSAKDFYPELNSRIWQEYDASPFALLDAQRLADTPVFFADCTDDLLMPENQAGLKKFFPTMKQKIFTQCAHFPWVEKPSVFYPWLNRVLVK
jgi:pimeloyl-ACP methyl ester carboxylesterase